MFDLSRPCFTFSAYLVNKNKQILNRFRRIIPAITAVAAKGVRAPMAWAAPAGHCYDAGGGGGRKCGDDGDRADGSDSGGDGGRWRHDGDNGKGRYRTIGSTMRTLMMVLASSVAFVAVSAIAQTSQFVYKAGTPYGGSSEELIYGYSINGASGALTAIPNAPFSAGDSVQVMAAHPSGNFVYAATTGSSGSHVAAFSVDAVTGGLTPVSGSPYATGPSSGYPDGQPAYPLLAMDPSGKFLFVANRVSGQIQQFSVDAASGALTPLSQASVPDVIAFAESPLGGHLYAYTSIGTAAYSIDPTSGALTLVQTTSGFGCGFGQMTIDRSGRFLYGFASYGISACQIDPSSGMLTPLNGSPFPVPVGFDYLAADPSGPFLYAVTTGSVTSNPAKFFYGFTIDAATGALAAVPNSPFGLPNISGNYAYVFGVSVEPRGKYAYVVEGNNGLASYSVNQTTGGLSLISSSFGG